MRNILLYLLAKTEHLVFYNKEYKWIENKGVLNFSCVICEMCETFPDSNEKKIIKILILEYNNECLILNKSIKKMFYGMLQYTCCQRLYASIYEKIQID